MFLLRRAATTLATAATLAGASPAVAAPSLPLLSGPDLTRAYRGSDGSALYTRAAGAKVVGFGEDGRTTRYSFVFEGNRSGGVIIGKFWDVAKGGRTASGVLHLSQTDGGATLTRIGGDDLGPESWTAIPEDEMNWSKRREAGFQSTSATDLDGAFDGADGSRAYVRQTTTDIVGVTERWLTPLAARPLYATVFIGTRAPSGALAGSWWDVPKGVLQGRGSLWGLAGSQPRGWTQALYDATKNAFANNRAFSYEADYAVDLDEFAAQIEQRLTPFTVGFGYAIAADGQVVRQNGVGSRRIPLAGNDLTESLPFNAETQNEIASTTKTVTAVVVARALWQRGISLDTPVDPYLPAQWIRGPGMDTVTFRQLFKHIGLRHPGTICNTDFYACLQEAVAAGLTGQANTYNNIHFTLMRVILPFIVKPQEMADLFVNQPVTAFRNLIFSDVFRDEVVATMAAAGVAGDFAYTSDDLAYTYAWGTPPTNEFFDTQHESDFLAAGSGGLKMNAVEYAKFLAAFQQGAFVPRAMVRDMQNTSVGFDDQNKTYVGTGGIGPLHQKNGGAAGAASQNMMYPGDVQAFVTRNSTGNAAQTTNDRDMLRAAWQAALI